MHSRLPIKYLGLEQLVKSQIKNWDSYPKDAKYRVKCPNCDVNKTPALSILRDFHAGICFRCEVLYINDVLLSKLDTVGKRNCLEDLKEFVGDKDKLIEINKTILDLYESPENNEFLKTRNPFVKDWSYYGIRQGTKEVITPYFMFDDLVYYQIRQYDPRGFFNPKQVSAPLYIPSDVNTEPGKWYQDCPTIICEGPFDAIALDCSRQYLKKRFNIVALGGKVMTDYREQLLKTLGVSKLFIFLDEFELSNKLGADMKYNFGNDITIIPSNGPDPEEVLRGMGLENFSNWISSIIFKPTDFFKPKKRFIDNNKSSIEEKFIFKFK